MMNQGDHGYYFVTTIPISLEGRRYHRYFSVHAVGNVDIKTHLKNLKNSFDTADFPPTAKYHFDHDYREIGKEVFIELREFLPSFDSTELVIKDIKVDGNYFYNDPDDMTCSREVTVRSIDIEENTVKIEYGEGVVYDVLPTDLSAIL